MSDLVLLNHLGVITSSFNIVAISPVVTLKSSTSILRDHSPNLTVLSDEIISVATRYEVSQDLATILIEAGWDVETIEPEEDDEDEDTDLEDADAEEDEEEEAPKARRGRGSRKAEPEPEPEVEETSDDDDEDYVRTRYILTDTSGAFNLTFREDMSLFETTAYTTLAEDEEVEAKIAKIVAAYNKFVDELEVGLPSVEEDDLGDMGAPPSTVAAANAHTSAVAHQQELMTSQLRKDIERRIVWLERNVLGVSATPDAEEGEIIPMSEALDLLHTRTVGEDGSTTVYDQHLAEIQKLVRGALSVL